MNPVAYYAAYLIISLAFTVGVGWTLHKNGRVFLIDALKGEEAVADAVNHLLLVGFYLVNIGFVTLALRYGDMPANIGQAIEYCSTKIGLVLVVLGIMHFLNLFVFARMRRRAAFRRAIENDQMPPLQAQDNIVFEKGATV